MHLEFGIRKRLIYVLILEIILVVQNYNHLSIYMGSIIEFMFAFMFAFDLDLDLFEEDYEIVE